MLSVYFYKMAVIPTTYNIYNYSPLKQARQKLFNFAYGLNSPQP